MKYCTRWFTSWNQDCQEKYQQLQMCRQYHSNGRKWRGAKKPLKGERGEWKSWLFWIQHSNNEYHGIWSHHFMTNRWGKSGSSDRFSFFLGSKITENGDYSHKIKRLLLLGRKTMKNLDSVLKSRDTTLLTKVHIVKGVVFPVQLSRSIVSTSLRPHGLQHARLPCPSSSPRTCSNSCLWSWWCHPTISSSVVPFS